jgi:hypothetical protein
MRRTLPGLALFFTACTVVAPEGGSLEAVPSTDEPAAEADVDDFTIRAAGEKSFLLIDGVNMGALSYAMGGGLSAEVASEPLFGGLGKTVYNVVPEPIEIQFTTSIGPAARKWLSDTWNDGKNNSRDGEVLLGDANLKAISTLTFQDAQVDQITVSALDGASKEHLSIGVRLQPAWVEEKPASGTITAGSTKGAAVASNFKFELDGVTIPVRRIEAFTFKTTPSPGDTDFPVLKIRVAPGFAKNLLAWANDFLANGNFNNERNGRITLLKPNLSDELANIDLAGMGVRRFARVPGAMGSEYEFELYVEKMKLSFTTP